MRSSFLFLLAALASAFVPARGEVRLPAVISDHLVLQAGKPVPVWGWAAPGETVTVDFAGQSVAVLAGPDGRWTARLAALKPAAEGRILTVRGRAASKPLTVRDVLVGEVWLASGQSNMEFPLRRSAGAETEIAGANHPKLRMFIYDRVYGIYRTAVPPRDGPGNPPGRWRVCTPAEAGDFSAIGYYFGRELRRRLGVPVGIIDASVGGTPIEAWTSLPAQEAVPELRPLLDFWRQKLTGYDLAGTRSLYLSDLEKWRRHEGPKPELWENRLVMAPGRLFNGVIAPLAPYAIRGVIWYQGEKNCSDIWHPGPPSRHIETTTESEFSRLYGRQLRVLIADWRALWGDDVYFGWVQLPRAKAAQSEPSEGSGWGVIVRDGMRRDLDLPRTGMAITIDFGGPSLEEGHPKNKADFARRLWLWALHDAYGQPIPEWSGPLYRSAEPKNGRIIVAFDHAAGLKAVGGELRGFAISGADRRFVWARARIEDGRVAVWSDQVAAPAAVRYDWAPNPDGNLRNGADLPASPFRTDDWAEPALGRAVASLVASGKFAGAVALVASRDRVLGVETAGYADLAAGRRMRADDLFWIASMSKPIAATAMMMLVDEGKVRLDDPVEKYLPEFKDLWVKEKSNVPPPGRRRPPQTETLVRPIHPITIRNLLTHTSGLVPRSPFDLPHIDLLPLREDVRVYPLIPLAFQPGSRYQYSNSGINTAGRIVEVVSGMPYEEFLQKRIFTPLGMKDTTFWPTPSQLTRLAKSYQRTSDKEPWRELLVDQLRYPLDDPHRGVCPAGGLFSTAEDVSLFGRMILDGGVYGGRRYLSRAAVAEMTSVQTGDLPLSPPADAGYGFGWMVPRQIPGHAAPAGLGEFAHGGAYATRLTVDPVHGLVTVMMVQRAETPPKVRDDAADELRRAVLAEFGN